MTITTKTSHAVTATGVAHLSLKHGDILKVASLRSFPYQRVFTIRGYYATNFKQFRLTEEQGVAQAIERHNPLQQMSAECMVLADDGLSMDERYAREGVTVQQVEIGQILEIEGILFRLLKPHWGSECRLETIERSAN